MCVSQFVWGHVCLEIQLQIKDWFLYVNLIKTQTSEGSHYLSGRCFSWRDPSNYLLVICFHGQTAGIQPSVWYLSPNPSFLINSKFATHQHSFYVVLPLMEAPMVAARVSNPCSDFPGVTDYLATTVWQLSILHSANLVGWSCGFQFNQPISRVPFSRTNKI
jgi:hypothetical protein